jgi:hypothetical protein
MYHSRYVQWEFYDPQMSNSIDETDLISHGRAITQVLIKQQPIATELFIKNVPSNVYVHIV